MIPTVVRWACTSKAPTTRTITVDETPDSSILGKKREHSRTVGQLAFQLDLVDFPETLYGRLFLAERLDHTDAGQIFVQ